MMLTRCPGCTTTFRVTPEQVKARHGKVRCGRCQHVFDAIEFLVDAPAQVPGAAEQAPSAPAPAAPVVPVQAAITEPAVPDTPETPAAITHPDLPEEDPEVAARTPVASDDILLQPSPLSTSYAKGSQGQTPSWPWAIASLLVLLALITQLMVAYRVDLATKYPGMQPVLSALCEQLQCVIELPSKAELVSIEASDLHPAKKGGLELTATLRNSATHVQSWPHLELTLTDGADKPIVRKVIAPAQYLPATQSETDGFAANGELAVQLLLDAGTLPAAGYRLYLFYP